MWTDWGRPPGCSTDPWRDPHAADRWTWLIITADTQVGLASTLTADLRRPWERPATAGRLTPPESAEEFGTSSRRPTTQPRTPARLGQLTKRELTVTARKQQTG